jgi:uncharacterized protein
MVARAIMQGRNMLDLEDFSYTDGDVDTNPTSNQTIHELIETRYSRRAALFGGIAAAALPGFVLSGCGEGTASAADALQVSAGDVAAKAGRVVTLNGSVSGATTTALNWTQISGPPVTLTGADTATASFVAPGVSSSTPLQFQFSAGAVGGGKAATSVVSLTPAELGFTPVAKNLNDIVTVPAGYNVSVLYRLGDPIAAGVAAYANDGTDSNFAQRSGDHHDGMYYFGLAATGNTPDPNSNTRGILCINHENITSRYLHPNGQTTTGGVRPVAEAIKEIECHGVSVIEVTRAGNSGAWSYVQNSALNRRITPFTPTQISGPARGHPLMRTLYSPSGTEGRGTINNCANGFTPWGTYLTCEENWTGYFRRDASDVTARAGTKSAVSLARYGRGAASGGNNGWTNATPVAAGDTRFAKFNITINAAAPADGTGDFRNEHNQYGWNVEIDPYDPTAVPRKRTAMGRMNHEGAWPGRFIAGVKPAWYQGCDAQNEYLYKYVAPVAWAPADATATNRMAIGDKYLDTGTLYVARFDANGTGVWLPLVFGTGPVTAANAAYSFSDAGDVAINSRLAADAVGATRMDRPEWTAVNPKTGEMYLTLTNNASRTGLTTDAANPRAYVDPPSTTRANRNGHIIRLRESGDTTEALAFTWDIYAFGAGSDLEAANINVSGLTADNDFSSPDGLWFSRTQNAGGVGNPLLWVQTDDGAFTDVTNCMMLVGQPGQVGDGGARMITNTLADGTTRGQATLVGALPGTNLRRFLVGPKECEITGIDSTPDGRTVFVNIQHPGEDTTTGFPNTFPSNWPASQTNASAVSRPRSATIVITKADGGVVGV